jgi:hypothetical protein
MKPNTLSAYVLITAMTPISHHDPAGNDGSNMLTFNRQKQIITRPAMPAGAFNGEVSALCIANPVPETVVDIVRGLQFNEFAAAAFVRLLIDIYNSAEGTGLFSGMRRYEMLESRLRSAAVRSQHLRGLWAHLTRDLKLPIHGGGHDQALVTFFALPPAVQQSMIAVMLEQQRSVVTIARLWSTQAKLNNENYAAALNSATVDLVMLNYDNASIAESKPSLVIEVPSVSTNSLRHQAVREPGWLHFVERLGLADQLAPGVEAIFDNGGNIRAGAKAPSNAYFLAHQIREKYPLLDLVGGVTDSFDLGESILACAGWLVCRENRDALLGTPAEGLPLADISAFDMLDDVTATRQATQQGVGQMIYNYETLAKGTQIALRLALHPLTRPVTAGALVAAVETWREQLAVVAGQSARGFGHVTAEWLTSIMDADDRRAEYETYLLEQADELRAGLIDGTLGTGTRVLS